MIIAIDPGPETSAYVVLSEDQRIINSDEGRNEVILLILRHFEAATQLVIEQVAAMGMAVGAEVFETVFWTGRFCQEWETRRSLPFARIKRHAIKMHLCGNMRAKDANIRQALIDKLGKPGTKKAPGPTYGISSHRWAALAVGITYLETTND